MQQQYNPSEIEPKVQRYWAENKVFKAVKDVTKENTIAFQCCLIRQVSYIWGTFVTTPLVM